MSSISARFPSSDIGSPPLAGRQGSPTSPRPTPGLYNLDNCVNCGYRYEVDKQKYDLNGDATMPWRRLSSVVTEHYSSCPRKFANIHLPTSALRETLKKSTESNYPRQDKFHAASIPSPLPSRQQSSRDYCDLETDRSHRRPYKAYAFPDSYSRPEWRTDPTSLDPSRRAAELVSVGVIKSAPHYSNSRPGKHQSTGNALPTSTPRPHRELLYNSPSRTSPVHRTSSSVHLSPPPSPTTVSPPRSRKRKHSELQDPGTDAHRVTHGNEVEETRPRLTGNPNTPPLLQTNPDHVPRKNSRDLDLERPDKRLKKNIMNPEVRQEILEDDPLLIVVKETEVYCGVCKKWIKLDARNVYYPGLWYKHRKTMHGTVTETQWDCVRRERARKADILEEGERQCQTERGGARRHFKSGVKAKKDDGKNRIRSQESLQGQSRSPTTRSSPSS